MTINSGCEANLVAECVSCGG